MHFHCQQGRLHDVKTKRYINLILINTIVDFEVQNA